MSIPRKQRQWDIYRANLGEGPDCCLLVLSSNETNEIMESQVLSCELVLESVQRLAATPITLRAQPDETGLPEPVTISVATVASIPRNCLIDLAGRLEPLALRLAVDNGIQILLGNERWP